MAKPKGYELTMVVPAEWSTRLDALAERGMALRKQAGQAGHIGMRDVVLQAIEVGVETIERSLADTETAGRTVLTPAEWAARLGGQRGGRRW